MSSVGSVVAQEWRNHWNTVAEQTQNNALFDTVTVSSPTTVGTLLSKYVVYNVKSEPSGTSFLAYIPSYSITYFLIQDTL